MTFREELADLIEKHGGTGVDLRVDLRDALEAVEEAMAEFPADEEE